MKGLWLCMLSVLMPMAASAQTVVKVPFIAAKFAWTNGVVDATHSAATAHVVTCGTITVSVPMPANSILLSAVVPSPGVYTCNLYAKNDFGRQAEANVPFPQFEAGFVPNAPTSPQLVVP